ncbi:MAG: lysozyme [Alphaproteobacteria bacterium]|nr:lysozyme [Alphaproteobacteria bacterium]
MPLNNFKTSDKGKTLIRYYETLATRSYVCSAGKKTIGYGHVILSNERFKEPISAEEANLLFSADLRFFEKAVNELGLNINQDQFDALVSFNFNCGIKAFRTSTLMNKIVAGDLVAAAAEFPKWNKFTNPKTGKLESLVGLTRRRAAEAKLFSTGIYP